MAVCSRAGQWAVVLRLASEQLAVEDVVDRSSGLGTALMDCEQHRLLPQRRLLTELGRAVAPAAAVALRFSARLARRVTGHETFGEVK